MANDSVYAARRRIVTFGLVVLLGLAGAKLFVAFQRGRFNVLFLIILAAVFSIYLIIVYNKERTCLGDRVLSDLSTLFKDLKKRGKQIKQGGETNEVALLAAVFGLAALSSREFPHVKKLFLQSFKNSDSSFSFYAGGSGSSCGSSCGGGGCGGGCGGCGS